jgi:hypothetical protein
MKSRDFLKEKKIVDVTIDLVKADNGMVIYRKDLSEYMEEFAKIKCEKQRLICFNQMKHHKFGNYIAKKESILNAPQPEM